MIEWIVEDDALVLFKISDFVSHSHPCSFCTDQRQMDSQLLTSWSIVRVDMWSWGKCTEEGMMVVSRNYLLQDLDGLRDFFAVFLKLNIMEKKIEDIPVSCICCQGTYFILWLVLRRVSRASVWLKAFLISQINQFLSDDRRIALKFLDPRKIFPLPKCL